MCNRDWDKRHMFVLAFCEKQCEVCVCARAHACIDVCVCVCAVCVCCVCVRVCVYVCVCVYMCVCWCVCVCLYTGCDRGLCRRYGAGKAAAQSARCGGGSSASRRSGTLHDAVVAEALVDAGPPLLGV
jgi:hypothetical protein